MGVPLLRTVTIGLLTAAALAGCQDGETPAEGAGSATPVGSADPTVVPSARTTSPPVTSDVTTGTAVGVADTTTSTGATSTDAGATTPSSVVTPATTGPATAEAEPSSDGLTGPVAPDAEVFEIGRSVEGRAITVIRRGEPGGSAVLVIGVIHGDEDAGTAIVDELATAELPDGIELWLVRSMNPDGQTMRIRHNANGVDLNRNFPVDWGPIAAPGDWQYAGPSAASEPETRAMLALADLVRPDLTLWYHQDLFRINPGRGREGEVRVRYAELTGLPMVEVTGGRYTGTASTWSRSIATDQGVGFTVELGPALSADDARRHAEAVLTVASEL